MRAITPRRSGPAGNTPPTTRSATSVVVMSRTRVDHARVDQLLHRLPARSGGVEHERIESLAEGRDELRDEGGGDAEHRQTDGGQVGAGSTVTGCATMPAMALAALPSTSREMRLSPATSVTEYIMAMSAGPT